MFFKNLMGSVLSEYPSQVRDPGRGRLGTCLSGTNCSSNCQKHQLHGAMRFCEHGSFPLSSLGLSPLLSQKVFKPPSPSMGNSCLPFKPQFGCHFLQDLSFSDGTSLPCFLKSVVLSHHNSQVSVGQSSASHVDAFLSPHLELKITSIPHSC